ncbi:MAG: gliding motility protein GldM [Bacteroidales bacterium]|nr:gliding motility protein GldM [Bacteroidales bacterium]
MGHGKETPRQKMIGMMYLVLTALLALNVSKDILNAFVLVDEGLTITNENFAEKNKSLYDDMSKLSASNPAKVAPWQQKADEIRKRTTELVNFLHEVKVLLVKTADGEDAEAIKDKNKIEGMKVEAKDDADVPTRLMVGDFNNGKGKEINEKFVKLKQYCLSLIRPEDKDVRVSIEKLLNTDDPPMEEGVKHSWESAHFGEIPLIAVTTILSKMQGDVRNVESEMIRYLLSQIDAGSFKFNKLEAIVTTNSNYILKGNKYQAEVFISARDTTQSPEVMVGRYEQTKNTDGSISYKMVGNYESLKIQPNGRGLYERAGGAQGNNKWGGLVKIKSPEGIESFYPFEAEYQVAEASAVISPTKMNVFYLGVDNPVEISVAGVPADKIRPSITNGSIVKTGNSYIVRPKMMGNAIVTVEAQIDGQWKNMGFMDFRVKKVPDPVGKVAGRKGGVIDKNLLAAQLVVQADLENFDFDLKFQITEFKVSASQGGFVKDEISKSNRITPGQLDIIRNMGKGQKVYFEDIKAVGPDGSVRELGTIVFKIN